MTTAEFYASISTQIVEQLERGNLQPWKCPWSKTGGGYPLRHNGIPYRGINVLWLFFTAAAKGHSSPYYMTFQQAKEYGGCVKKGEKSTPVLFCQPKTKESTGEDGTKSKESFWISRSYNVFNADQISGLPDQFTAQVASQLDPSQKIEHAETFFANTGAKIEHSGHAAYYRKLSDAINMPPFESFHSPEGYYSTLAHEVAHWTGPHWRLNRFTFCEESRAEYAREEIVAELAATMLTAQLGFDPVSHSDHAAYLDFWIKAIREDARYLFTAASKAQAACDYLANFQPKAD